MGDILSKVLDFIFVTLSGMTDNGELSSMQAVFIVLFSSLVLMAFFRAKDIFGIINNTKNAKLDGYNYILKNYELNSTNSKCIKDDISRIIRYRLSGISDVARQRVIFKLISLNNEVISPGFFKKFRTFLEFKDGLLIFNKGIGFRLECLMYFLFSFQYLLIAISFVAISLYKGNSILAWEHWLLYVMALLLFMMFIAFGKIIPTPKECLLIEDFLQLQYEPPSSE